MNVEPRTTDQEFVTSWKLVGDSYRGGLHVPGWGECRTNRGRTLFVPVPRGIDGILEYADQVGVSTQDARARLQQWVKTGQ